MKQLIAYITIILTLVIIVGCIDRPSSGIEPEPSVVYVNLSEDNPSGIDTIFVGPQDTTLLVAGTFAPGFPPNYEWASENPDVFKIIDMGGDGTSKMITALGDSGETTIISVRDTENDGVKNVYAKVLKWADPALYNHIGDFNGHVYFISKTPASWGAARTFCLDEEGYLATVTTEEENDFLVDHIVAYADTNVWIGAAFILPTNTDSIPAAGVTWEVTNWDNGEPWDYENWGTKSAVETTTRKQFLSMRPDGKFENMSPVPFLYLLEIDYED